MEMMKLMIERVGREVVGVGEGPKKILFWLVVGVIVFGGITMSFGRPPLQYVGVAIFLTVLFFPLFEMFFGDIVFLFFPKRGEASKEEAIDRASLLMYIASLLAVLAGIVVPFVVFRALEFPSWVKWLTAGAVALALAATVISVLESLEPWLREDD